MTNQTKKVVTVLAVFMAAVISVLWVIKVADTKQARQVLADISREYPYSRHFLQPLVESNPSFLARSSTEEVMKYVARQVENAVNSVPTESWSDSTFVSNLKRHFYSVGISHLVCQAAVSSNSSLCVQKAAGLRSAYGIAGKTNSWLYRPIGTESWFTNRKSGIEGIPKGSSNLWWGQGVANSWRTAIANNVRAVTNSSETTIAKTAWVNEFNRRKLGRFYIVKDASGPYGSATLTERQARTLRVCNYAPYMVTTALALPVVSEDVVLRTNLGSVEFVGDHDSRKLSGWHHARPGECKEIYIGRYSVTPGDVGIYSRMEGGNANLSTYLRNIVEYKNYWGEERPSWGGADYFACVTHEILERVVESSENACSKGASLANFYNVSFPADGDFTWHILDDVVCESTPNIDCDAIGPDFAGGYARSLSSSLERQATAYSWWKNGPAPYMLGVNLTDINGAFEPGVKVKDLPYGNVTPFGNAIMALPGDSIVSFNGIPVYSIKDMQYALYQFGQNRVSGGVNKTFGYKVKRGDQYYYLEGSYFFNPQYQWSGNICSASWKGIVSSATIGMDAEVLCALPNILTGAANFLSGFAAGLSGTDSYETYAYNNLDECIFNAKQEKWMLKQFCAVEYENAAFFGLFVSAPRALAQGALKKSLPKIAGSKATARVFRDIMIESSEAAAWAYMDMPVGATSAETFAEMKKGAKLGGAVGLATALVGGTKKK